MTRRLYSGWPVMVMHNCEHGGERTDMRAHHASEWVALTLLVCVCVMNLGLHRRQHKRLADPYQSQGDHRHVESTARSVNGEKAAGGSRMEAGTSLGRAPPT